MIVEDEPLIRLGLKKYFNWKELGIHTIVEAENGLEGVEVALRERPDLIITDIQMPQMDGLQMIEELRPALPGALFIILTGHNKFQYAQKAIHYGGVHDFLIKPLQYEESLSSLLECIDKLHEKRKALEIRSTLEKNKLKVNASHIVKRLLEDENPLSEKSIHHLIKFKSPAYKYQAFVMTAIPDHISESYKTQIWWRSNADRMIKVIVELIIPPGINNRVLTYMNKSKLYAVLVYDDANKLTINKKVKAHILSEITDQHDTSLFLAISEPTLDFTKIGSSLQITHNMLYQRFFESDCHLFFSDQIDQLNDSHIELTQNEKKLILSYLEKNDPSQIKGFMESLAKKIPQTSSGQLFTFLQEIITVIRQFAHKNGIAIDGVYHDYILNLTFVDEFYHLNDLFERITSWMIKLTKDLLDNQDHSNSQEIQLFKQIELFIREHLDENLTLNMIAEHFFYNPSYLSRLFKTKLNKNYMDFVREIKIDVAKTYLQEAKYSVTDVSKISGYNSYKHFVKVFKTLENITPTEYRKQLRI